MLTVALGALGSIVGSFLNVVVYRVPLGRSVVSPSSACPRCGRPVRPIDNIPVVSWLVLRGRCRDCGAPISARYPLVEIGAGLLFAAVAWRFLPAAFEGTTAPAVVGSALELTGYLYLAAISIALALIDLDTRRLPDAIVLPAYAVGAVVFTLAAVITGDWPSLVTAGIGLACLGGFYLVLNLVAPGGMGFGDVKLAGVLGLFLGWLGWPTLVVGALAGFIVGGLFGVALLASGRAGRRSSIPFGPWMLAGAWIGVFGGPFIASAYFSVLGLG